MVIFRLRIGVATLGALLALSACAPGHHALRISDEDLRSRRALDCPVEVTKVVDERRSTTVASLGNRSYAFDDATGLIQAALATWQFGRAVGGHSLELRLRLLRAYGQYKNTSNVVTVVMIGELSSGERQVLRGQHAVFNWWANQAEMEQGISRALQQAMESAYDWLAEQCTADSKNSSCGEYGHL